MTSFTTLSFDTQELEHCLIAKLDGEIDLSNAEDLKELLVERLDNSKLGLVLDFRAVSFIDSAGIRVLFELANALSARGQQLRMIIGEESPLIKVFSLVDLAQMIPLHPSGEDALEGVLSTR